MDELPLTALKFSIAKYIRWGLIVELISDGGTLNRRLLSALSKYPKFSFASAWASADTQVFKAILANASNLQNGVIGTHFYQTHPDVLDKCIRRRNVKFYMQPSGVFHPKVFVFWDDNKCEIFVGSANLTQAAMTRNSEVVVRLTDQDFGMEHMKRDLKAVIKNYWNEKKAMVMTKPEADIYRAQWRVMRSKLRSISGDYGEKKEVASPSDSNIMTMDWKSFCRQVKQSSGRTELGSRLGLLETSAVEFRRALTFATMDDGARRMIAGLKTSFYRESGWFGSMGVARQFQSAVIKGNPHLSRAVDMIPLNGDVSEGDYNAFVKEFQKAFPKGGDGVATATRLLALKRPDQFVCLDSKNRKSLCKDFGISPTTLTYERYWHGIIGRVRDSLWWNSPKPTGKTDTSIWLGRAALLDAIGYERGKS